MKAKRFLRSIVSGVAFLAVAAWVVVPASAQRQGASAAAVKPRPGSYDIAKDVSVQGTVLKYTENSQTAPIGTHVLVQTASGVVDVHLGDARVLHLAKMTITPGANIRFIGQSRAIGTNSIFLARLVQMGTQILAVRTEHGLPLGSGAVLANKSMLASAQANDKGGAR